MTLFVPALISCLAAGADLLGVYAMPHPSRKTRELATTLAVSAGLTVACCGATFLVASLLAG